MLHRSIVVLGLLAVAGCGDDNPASGSTGGSTTGAATSEPASGGSTSASQGGSSDAAGGSTEAGGNSTAKGGASPSGGVSAQGGSTVVAGNPCTANCPTGTLDLCFSVGCPLGACDNSRFQASTICSALYPNPIDSNTIFCAQGQTGSYCMASIDRVMYYAVVRCVDGTPTIEPCTGGCGVDSAGVASC